MHQLAFIRFIQLKVVGHSGTTMGHYWDTVGTPRDVALVATDRRGARGVRIWLDVLRMIHAIAGLAKSAHSL